MKTCRTDDRSAYLGAMLALRLQGTPGTPLAAARYPNALFAIMRDVATLRRNAKALQRLAEHDCNYGLTPRQQTRRDSLGDQCKQIANVYRLNCQTSGDPRGAVVKLADPMDERAGDGFGGGWPVY